MPDDRPDPRLRRGHQETLEHVIRAPEACVVSRLRFQSRDLTCVPGEPQGQCVSSDGGRHTACPGTEGHRAVRMKRTANGTGDRLQRF